MQPSVMMMPLLSAALRAPTLLSVNDGIASDVRAFGKQRGAWSLWRV